MRLFFVFSECAIQVRIGATQHDCARRRYTFGQIPRRLPRPLLDMSTESTAYAIGHGSCQAWRRVGCEARKLFLLKAPFLGADGSECSVHRTDLHCQGFISGSPSWFASAGMAGFFLWGVWACIVLRIGLPVVGWRCGCFIRVTFSDVACRYPRGRGEHGGARLGRDQRCRHGRTEGMFQSLIPLQSRSSVT